MPWAVFETDEDDTMHVAPCDDEGETEHILSEQCPCHPCYDQGRAAQGTRPLLLHDYVQ